MPHGWPYNTNALFMTLYIFPCPKSGSHIFSFCGIGSLLPSETEPNQERIHKLSDISFQVKNVVHSWDSCPSYW